MSRTRLRQIARLEELAQPYIERRRQIEKEWQRIPPGAAAHAAVLAFVIRYGDPKIGETFHQHRRVERALR
jgi:ABC-type sulfate transport system substrate-binding protein